MQVLIKSEFPTRNLMQMEPLILIAEDDAGTSMVAAAILTSAGFPTLQAADGQAALRLLEEQNAISILFTDIIMPGMDGFTLANTAVERWPRLRVLYTTTLAKLRDVDEQPSLLLGPILLKPYGKAELIAAIEKTLARPPPGEQAWRVMRNESVRDRAKTLT
jgi:CheY-like chemotaxis protein